MSASLALVLNGTPSHCSRHRQEVAALTKNKVAELGAARLAAEAAAEEARRLEERNEAEMATAQAGNILKEVQELQQERRAILEAAEIARQAAREHEEALAQLARDVEEVRRMVACLLFWDFVCLSVLGFVLFQF
jgi:uncharacterized coiled-coil DUF342 family protein